MKIKQIASNTIIFATLIGIVSIPFTQAGSKIAASSAQKASMPKPNTPEFEAMMEEQMEELGKFLDKKSPQEQEEIIKILSAIGEQIINEATEKGYSDPFEYIAKELDVADDEEYSALPVETEPEFAPREKISLSDEKQAIEQIRSLLQSLGDILSSLRQKTNASVDLSSKVSVLKYRIDDLIYFTRLFDDSKFASYLLKKEFTEITRKIENLYDSLYPLIQALAVSDFNLKGEDPYAQLEIAHGASQSEIVEAFHKQASKHHPDCIRNDMARNGKSAEEMATATKKAEKTYEKIKEAYQSIRDQQEATFLVNKALDQIALATEPGSLIDGFKKILEAYEPEALKKRQEKEKMEVDARKMQESLVRQRPAISYKDFDMPSASMSNWRGSNLKDTGNYGTGGYTPSSWSQPQSSFSPNTSGGATFGSSSTPSRKSDTPGGSGKTKDEKSKDKKEDKKGDKSKSAAKPKPAKDEAVLKAAGAIELLLEELKSAIEKNQEVLAKLPSYLKSPSSSDTDSEKITQALGKVAITASNITRRYKAKKSELAKDKDKAKTYEEEVQKIVKKFKETQEGKLISKIAHSLNKEVDQVFEINEQGNIDVTKSNKISPEKIKEFSLKAEAGIQTEEPAQEENQLKIFKESVKNLFDILPKE